MHVQYHQCFIIKASAIYLSFLTL